MLLTTEGAFKSIVPILVMCFQSCKQFEVLNKCSSNTDYAARPSVLRKLHFRGSEHGAKASTIMLLIVEGSLGYAMMTYKFSYTEKKVCPRTIIQRIFDGCVQMTQCCYRSILGVFPCANTTSKRLSYIYTHRTSLPGTC